MFTRENAKELGSKGGKAGGQAGGSTTSETKRLANIEKMEQARAEGKLTGRPASQCTCGQDPHRSVCRVYNARKQRERRQKLKEMVMPVQVAVKPVMPTTSKKQASEKQMAAARKNSKVVTEKRSEKAREIGRLYGGRPPSVCNCGKVPHTYKCRVYAAEKKAESRQRLKEKQGS